MSLRGMVAGSATAVLLLLATGCGSDDAPDDEADGPVCGLITRDVVTAVTGDREFTESGDLKSVDDGSGDGECQLTDGDQTFLSTTVVDLVDDADVQDIRAQLQQEYVALAETCPGREEVTTPGPGNACVTDEDIDLAVATDTRLIRLTLNRVDPDVTLDDATAIAADIDEQAGD